MCQHHESEAYPRCKGCQIRYGVKFAIPWLEVVVSMAIIVFVFVAFLKYR